MNIVSGLLAIAAVVGMVLEFNYTATFAKLAAFVLLGALFLIADEIRALRKGRRD